MDGFNWHLTLSLGHGSRHDAVEIGVAAKDRFATRDLLRLVAVTLLALPFCSAMALAFTGHLSAAFPPGPRPWTGHALILAATIAVVVLLAGTLRVELQRNAGRTLRFLFRANIFESVILLLVGGLLLLFAAHFVADGIACMRGITRAC